MIAQALLSAALSISQALAATSPVGKLTRRQSSSQVCRQSPNARTDIGLCHHLAPVGSLKRRTQSLWDLRRTNRAGAHRHNLKPITEFELDLVPVFGRTGGTQA